MIRKIAAFVFALSFLGGAAAAQERATPAEAQAMAEAAAAYLAAEGPEVAFPAFNDGTEWHDRDLYVFAIDATTGVTAAHGADPAQIGQDMTGLADANGVHFIQEFIAIEDEGWVNYAYTNPVTGVVEPKQSYVVRVGDHVVGVGAYTPAM